MIDKSEKELGNMLARITTDTYSSMMLVTMCGCQIRKFWFPFMPTFHIFNCPYK